MGNSKSIIGLAHSRMVETLGPMVLSALDELSQEESDYTRVTTWHPRTTSTVTGCTFRGRGGGLFCFSFQTLLLSLLLFTGLKEILT